MYTDATNVISDGSVPSVPASHKLRALEVAPQNYMESLLLLIWLHKNAFCQNSQQEPKPTSGYNPPSPFNPLTMS